MFIYLIRVYNVFLHAYNMYTSFTYRAFYVIRFFDRHSGVCEVVALGTVSPRYDVTKFAGVHPGGTQILLEYAGKDRVGWFQGWKSSNLRNTTWFQWFPVC